MKFYDAIQLTPEVLKSNIRKTDSKKEQYKLRLAMLTRSVLIVMFAILMITPLSSVFGPENNCMGVVLICVILSIRFVDFGYCIQDSLRNLAIVFALLAVAPVATSLMPPLLEVFVHFGAVLLILTMTSDKPEMGNGGLFTFAYILLTGNPVHGELFLKRCGLTVLCYLICAVIFYCKHRGKHETVRYHHLLSGFHMSDPKCRWQVQLALGLGLVLMVGDLLHLERGMWAGFACASMLGCYSSTTTDTRAAVKEHFVDRIIGVVLGSLSYALIYWITPEAFHGMFGPLGGVCLGFCAEYRYKTALNCFGALMLATGLYGLGGSVGLRIINNFLGAAFGFAFVVLYQLLVNRRFEEKTA